METGFLAEKFRVASRPKKSEQPVAPALIEIDLSHIVFPQGSVNGLKAISLQNDNCGIFLVEDMKKPLADQAVAANCYIKAVFLQKMQSVRNATGAEDFQIVEFSTQLADDKIHENPLRGEYKNCTLSQVTFS